MRITRSLKNHSYTLSMRHQTWMAGLMVLSAKEERGPFLNNAVHCGTSKVVNINTSRHKVFLETVFPAASQRGNVLQHTFAVVNGVKYSKTTPIITSFGNLPSFGQIIEVYSFENEVVFVFKRSEERR